MLRQDRADIGLGPTRNGLPTEIDDVETTAPSMPVLGHRPAIENVMCPPFKRTGFLHARLDLVDTTLWAALGTSGPGTNFAALPECPYRARCTWWRT